MLKIYNTLTRKKENLTPIHSGKINMYVCGMTVYDLCHLGHARVLVFFDVVLRYLRACGYDVTYVRNITDIDDKIIQRANENGEPFTALTERFIDAMQEDIAVLNVLSPSREPRATEYVAHMIQLIERLMAKGYAYVAANGDVCFKVRQFQNYGCLAHRDLEQLQAGARVEIVESKQDPLDFVLWKLAKPNEPSWSSRWGEGRPGWHIECSAMAMDCLGEQFDIHGGGFDLQFPHHENEIAQSEAATGKRFVNTWMHVGYLQVNQEKMSKSLGNFFTIRDVLAHYPAEVVRYFLLSSHYRSPLNFADENLNMAWQALSRLYLTLRDITPSQNGDYADHELMQQFNAAMNDDFNTPQALAVLFDCAHEINRIKQADPAHAQQLAGLLIQLGEQLGILQQAPEQFLRSGKTTDIDKQQVEQLIAQRHQARQQKDWQRADEIRQQLLSLGIAIEDSAEKTVWRRKG